MTTCAAIRDAVSAAVVAGVCVVPPLEDGSKRPIGTWKVYQARRPTAAELEAWYGDGQRTGIGSVCGAVSGNLECLEFDERAVLDAFIESARCNDLAPLVARVRASYEERSPSGGVHWLYRCDEISGNVTLARRPTTEGERRHPGDRVKTLIQTRGIGGYIVCAPSYGRVHPTGRPYVLVAGGVATIPTLTPEERGALFALARGFDRPPASRPPRPSSRSIGTRTPQPGEILPGADFNQRADWERDVLLPAGWSFAYEQAGRRYFTRPGKRAGVSADVLGDVLFVFTSSTPLAADRGYSKFGAFAGLFHDGDFGQAAAALAGRGFGRRSPAGVPGYGEVL